jgi:hypothetical protein
MTEYIKPEYALMLIMVPPALVGAMFARNRGRNILVWALLSALFPIFLMVIYFQKPLRDVPGGFKRCASCGEFIKWKAAVCKYCSSPQPSSPPHCG